MQIKQNSQDESQLLMHLQSLERSMAKVLLEVCNRYNLKIWAADGTLLGCVRHHGFIPWDDDMDFVMMRQDYDKLREIIRSTGDSISPNPSIKFDIQREIVIKLRYEGTTMMDLHKTLSDHVNQSVWIDVFCLDDLPQEGFNDSEFKKIRTTIRIRENALLMSYATSIGIKRKISHFVCRMISSVVGKKNIYKYLRRLLKVGDIYGKSNLVANMMLFAKSPRYRSFSEIKKYQKRWFRETVMLPFDDMELPCPIGYLDYLTTQYGDWQTPVKNASMHTGIFIDIHRSYREVIRERLHGFPWWKKYFYTH